VWVCVTVSGLASLKAGLSLQWKNLCAHDDDAKAVAGAVAGVRWFPIHVAMRLRHEWGTRHR
jgi:hypothetical protein